jgi:gamma-glutamylaminecyclotransferase
MENSIHLWVYGTLKQGGRLHDAMNGASFMGEYRSVAGYQLVRVGWYPGLVASVSEDTSQTVAGELYDVPERMLEHLDQVEGAPFLFRREQIFLVGFSDPVEAYFYQGAIDGKPVVPNGEWPVA